MANTYITVGSYKLTVMAGTPDRTMPEDIIRVTLGNTTYKSLGNFKRRWTYRVLVKHTPDVGYASRSTLLTLIEDRTVLGQVFGFIDEYGTNQGDVVFGNCTYPEAVSTGDLDNSTAVYRCTIELVED